MKQKTSKGEIVLYKNKFEVKLEGNTVWLTQKQIAELFATERSVVTKHINNILKSKELEVKSVCANFAHTAEDGKIYQTSHYNLDAIISVGYRVNSNRATQFRIWATDILRKHLVDGYTINKKRLISNEEKIKNLQEAVRLFGNIVLLDDISFEAKGIIKIITEYSKAFDIIAAALFICFLQKNRILLCRDGSKRIDDNALVALTLMIASSKPSEKEIMVKVILTLLGDRYKKSPL